MSLTTAPSDRRKPRVHLWVRDVAPYGATERVRAIHDRLERMVEEGHVDAFDVDVWGRAVERSSADTAPSGHSASLRETVDEFVAWAERTGRTLEPAFTVHDRTSELAGEHDRVLSLPVICLAVYVDDTLAAVFPCGESEAVKTVEDCLVRLEADEPFVGEAERPVG